VGTIVKIREYRDKGLTKKATARRLGLDRKTVAKYWEGQLMILKSRGINGAPD